MSYRAFTGNDGWQVNIHYADAERVQLQLWDDEARQLAWFILWRYWARGTWFGVKRRLWYWALHQQLQRRWRWLAVHGDTEQARKHGRARIDPPFWRRWRVRP